MIETIFSFLSTTSSTIGSTVLAVMVLVSSFFGFATPPVIVSEVATSSAPAAPEIIPAPVVTPKPPPVVTSPPVVVTPPPVVVPPVVVPPVVTPPPTQTVGTTTLSVRKVPLLVGGTVHAGEAVPVSYMQITNVGDEGALVTGFWIVQNGSAPVASVIGLSTVDDKGVIRDVTGGTEGATPFQNGMAFAPTNAFFAPGQTRLFTIKALMTQNVSSYIGMQLMIEVASVKTTAETKSQQFPIRGTTWTIAE